MTCTPITRLSAVAPGWLLLSFVLLALGCGETEQITRYSVPKEAPTPTAQRDDVEPFETQPASAWFFKLTGPAETVAEIEDEFRALLESTSLNGGEPTWTLPEGWSRQPGSSMRFATLMVDKTDPPLELSVSRLSYRGDRDSYLRDNISRWRQQIGLPASNEADWLAKAEAAGEVEAVGGDDRDTTLVDLTGQTDDFPEARMLAAILLPAGSASGRPAGSAPPAMTPPPASTPAAGDGPLKYEVPEEWAPGEMSVMRVAAFQVTDGDRKVEITVIPAGGDVLKNVNLWRGQVGLDEWSEEELKQASEELTIDGQPAIYVELTGDEESIRGAILPGEPQSWFFKLKGDIDLAEHEAERFKAFVESVTFQ
jgi:hypothetical protein